MSYQKPKIGLLLQTDLPQAWLDDFQTATGLDRAEIEIRRVYSGSVAGMALYLPTAVMVLFASHYLKGLLTEAGKDHYGSLKTASKGLWHRLKLVRVSAIGRKAKTEDFDRFQMAFSINGETSNGNIFKLVLQLNTIDGVADAGIDSFFDLIRELNEGTVSPVRMERINSYCAIGGVIVLTIDPQSGDIVAAE